jgi:hypothetical protein
MFMIIAAPRGQVHGGGKICRGGMRFADGPDGTFQGAQPMNGAFLARSLWLTVMAMIVTTAGAGVLFAHQSLFAIFSGKFEAASIKGLVGISLGIAAYLLCRYRDDLIDDARA